MTSVDRDDLADGGAAHFAATIRAIRAAAPATTIEVLTPDFLKKGDGPLETVIAAKPDVFNHNLETVPSLYLTIRPGARYFHSLRLLQRAKELDKTMFTKSGIMLGLGEKRNEVLQLMDDLRSADVDFLTIGQYLQPTRKHAAVDRFVEPAEFESYKSIALAKGFLVVASSPLTRSSYHAGEDFAKLKAARLELMNKGLFSGPHPYLPSPSKLAEANAATQSHRIRERMRWEKGRPDIARGMKQRSLSRKDRLRVSADVWSGTHAAKYRRPWQSTRTMPMCVSSPRSREADHFLSCLSR